MTRADGVPSPIWYSSVTKTRGAELKVGDWLDGPDRSGARRIDHITKPAAIRTVTFAGGATSDVLADTMYDVVDPESLADPDGGVL